MAVCASRRPQPGCLASIPQPRVCHRGGFLRVQILSTHPPRSPKPRVAPAIYIARSVSSAERVMQARLDRGEPTRRSVSSGLDYLCVKISHNIRSVECTSKCPETRMAKRVCPAYGGSMRKYARFGRKIAKVARASENMHAARRRGDCENMQHEVRGNRAMGTQPGLLRQPFVRLADLSDCKLRAEFLVRALLISCGSCSSSY